MGGIARLCRLLMEIIHRFMGHGNLGWIWLPIRSHQSKAAVELQKQRDLQPSFESQPTSSGLRIIGAGTISHVGAVRSGMQGEKRPAG